VHCVGARAVSHTCGPKGPLPTGTPGTPYWGRKIWLPPNSGLPACACWFRKSIVAGGVEI
jgi:hypothetical protein